MSQGKDGGKEGVGGFNLSGADSSFSHKSSDIFGQLDALANKHDAFLAARGKGKGSDEERDLVKSDPVVDSLGGSRRAKDSSRDYRDRESRDDKDRGSRDYRDRDQDRNTGRDNRDRDFRRMGDRGGFRGGFRKPRGLPRKTPDHRVNPQKYTHYNLANVSEMSDRGNTAAAFDFLKERQKMREEEKMEDDSGCDKIVFKKPTTTTASSAESTDKLKSIAGKMTMPEYVVGQKSKASGKKKKKGSSSKGAASCSKIGLGHLDDEDEEEEQEDEADKAPVAFKKSSKSRSNMRRRMDDDEEEVNEDSVEKGTKRKGSEDEGDGMEVDGGQKGEDQGRKKAKAKRFVRQQQKGEDSDEEGEEG